MPRPPKLTTVLGVIAGVPTLARTVGVPLEPSLTPIDPQTVDEFVQARNTRQSTAAVNDVWKDIATGIAYRKTSSGWTMVDDATAAAALIDPDA